jgi:hypothetical protein
MSLVGSGIDENYGSIGGKVPSSNNSTRTRISADNVLRIASCGNCIIYKRNKWREKELNE